MKKKTTFMEILKNRENFKVPEHIEKKANQAIQRAAGTPPQKFFSLFYRPAFVYVIVALFLIIPSSAIIITFWGKMKNPVDYIVVNYPGNEENLPPDYVAKESPGSENSVYGIEVSEADYSITSKAIKLNWKNPMDNDFKEIVIEKRRKAEEEIKTFFPGNVSFYMDPEYEPGDYYRIRCINKENISSEGVSVTPGTGE